MAVSKKDSRPKSKMKNEQGQVGNRSIQMGGSDSRYQAKQAYTLSNLVDRRWEVSEGPQRPLFINYNNLEERTRVQRKVTRCESTLVRNRSAMTDWYFCKKKKERKKRKERKKEEKEKNNGKRKKNVRRVRIVVIKQRKKVGAEIKNNRGPPESPKRLWIRRSLGSLGIGLRATRTENNRMQGGRSQSTGLPWPDGQRIHPIGHSLYRLKIGEVTKDGKELQSSYWHRSEKMKTNTQKRKRCQLYWWIKILDGRYRHSGWKVLVSGPPCVYCNCAWPLPKGFTP